MTTQQNTEREGEMEAPRRNDKVEVVRILILAVASFILGFGLVILFLSPGDSTTVDDGPPVEAAAEAAPDPAKGVLVEAAGAGESGYAPAAEENPLIAAADRQGGATGKGENALADEADAPAEVPPGRTPEGVALDGDAFYLKCWDSQGQESPGSSCDQLSVLEKRFSTRLYVVDKCRQQHASGAEGKLSIGMEVGFDDNSLSFWNGASSTLDSAAAVSTCVRSELAGLPIHSVPHKFSRYRLFFTVLFGKAEAQSAAPEKKEDTTKSLAKAKGKMVNVVMDRVRVRKTPVNGDVIGKIGSGNQVTLLKKKGEWCQVLTPNENEGWMICEALEN